MWRSPKKPNDRFDPVHELIAGNLKCTGNCPSTLFFTVHKSASSFVGRLLDQIAKSQDQTSIDFDGYLHAVPESEADRHVRSNLVAQLQSDQIESRCRSRPCCTRVARC